MNGEINAREQLAIRFYMGDPEAVNCGVYRGGAQAYNTINALLHPESANEEDKVREGRYIGLEDADHLKEYIDVILNIYSAMCKYRDAHFCEGDKKSFRIDRKSSVDRFIADGGVIAGFFSTCRWGFLPQYAHKKAGIVLLEITRSSALPCLDFSELFGDLYAKPEEAEVLLPYGGVMSRITPVPLTEEEKKIFTDLHGDPPKGKWEIYVEPTRRHYAAGGLQDLADWVCAKEQVSDVITCMRLIRETGKLPEGRQTFYDVWKSRLQIYIQTCSELIEGGVYL